jgi:choline kinase/phosphatidylglycerophosphate synthase
MYPRDEPGRLKAVVLAAGDGGRLGLHTRSLPKPLVPVAGRPLIEYTLEALADVGVTSAIVVTGHRGEQLRTALGEGPGRPDLTFVSNPDYHRGASLSLRAARHLTDDEPFLLIMADHLLSAGLLEQLINAGAMAETSLLACDFSPADYHDISEATRLTVTRRIGEGLPAAAAIGKGLTPFDALDTGAFLLQRSAWEAVDAAPADCELSTIVAEIIRRDGVLAVDVSGEFWFDVDTAADLRLRPVIRNASAESLGQCDVAIALPEPAAQPADGACAVIDSADPERRDGAHWCWRYRCDDRRGNTGRILIQVVSVVDGVDGDLARLKRMTTRFGGVLDAVMDRYGDAVMLAGMTVYAVRFEDHSHAETVGLLALAGALVTSYSRARIEASLPEALPSDQEAEGHGRGATSAADAVFGLASRDVRLLVAAIGTVAGQCYWTLIVLAVVSGLTIAWRLLYLRIRGIGMTAVG